MKGITLHVAAQTLGLNEVQQDFLNQAVQEICESYNNELLRFAANRAGRALHNHTNNVVISYVQREILQTPPNEMTADEVVLENAAERAINAISIVQLADWYPSYVKKVVREAVYASHLSPPPQHREEYPAIVKDRLIRFVDLNFSGSDNAELRKAIDEAFQA